MPHWLLYPIIFIVGVVVMLVAILWIVSWGLNLADEADMDNEG